VFFGENFIEWMLLAFGGAMAVGNLAALIRPPKALQHDNLSKAPLWRSLSYVIVGVVVVIWALAGLIT
tara:strand:- start:442 stop:645 length:204 start_codon:yes stop_codon:yes gene_type:complete